MAGRVASPRGSPLQARLLSPPQLANQPGSQPRAELRKAAGDSGWLAGGAKNAARLTRCGSRGDGRSASCTASPPGSWPPRVRIRLSIPATVRSTSSPTAPRKANLSARQGFPARRPPPCQGRRRWFAFPPHPPLQILPGSPPAPLPPAALSLSPGSHTWLLLLARSGTLARQPCAARGRCTRGRNRPS